MKKFVYKYVFLVLLLLFIGFLPVIKDNSSVLIFNGDDYHQIYQFFLGGYNKLYNGFSLFDFSIGFGSNIFAMVYYLFNPTFLFTLLLEKSFIQYSFLYFTIFKLLLLFIFTYKWAKEIFIKENSILIGSFIITFSGWVFSYLHLYIFLDAFILYPLCLYFIEKYIKNNKFFMMVLTMSFIGMINYYFLYMFLPFVCIYALFRTLEIENNDIKTLFFKGFKFLLFCFLSISICSFILLPCFVMLKSNPRFDSVNITTFSHLSKLELFKVLSGLFVFNINHESTSLFIDINKYGFIGWGGGASLYSFVLSVMLLPLVFNLKNKKRKNILLCLFLMFFIMVFFKKFWYLLQLNLETRWFYMVSFIISFTVMSINDEIELKLIDNKKIYIGFIFYNCLAWLFFACSYLFHLTLNVKLLFICLLICSFISIINLVYYLSFKKFFLILALCMEVLVSCFLLVKNDVPIDSKITNLAFEFDNIVDEIKKDKGFYRVMYSDEYYDDFRYTTSNTPFAYNYNGVSFYSTIYNSEMEEFLKRLKNNWQMDQRYSSWDLYNLLSVKYIYAHSDLKQIPFGYKLKFENNGYKIYENENFVELGFSYNKTMSKEKFNSLSYLEQDLAFSDYLIIDNGKDFEYFNSLIDYGSMGGENDRYYAFDTPLNNCNVYIENFNVENVKISMFYKNNLVYVNDFWQYNYIDLNIDENTYVDLIVVSGNNENQNTDVKLKIKDLSGYKNYYNQRFFEKFYDVEFNKNIIKAKIDVDNDKWVFTSIPYDKGFKVYVNNEKVDFEKVNLGFIGFKVKKGLNNVVLKYDPLYFKEGLFISVGGLIVLIFLRINDKIKICLKKFLKF